MESDGIIGLALEPIEDENQELFIDEMFDQGVIEERVFTLFLGRNTSDVIEQSKIWIGEAIYPNYGGLQWVNVN